MEEKVNNYTEHKIDPPVVIESGTHVIETERALIKLNGVVIGEMKPITYIPNDASKYSLASLVNDMVGEMKIEVDKLTYAMMRKAVNNLRKRWNVRDRLIAAGKKRKQW